MKGAESAADAPESALRPACVVLAGGRGTRLGGGDKPLRLLGGRPILAHILDRLRPQCARIALSVNGDPERYAWTGLPCLPDTVVAGAGPLSGILAGLEWAAQEKVSDLIVSVSGDAPFLPDDLIIRLAAARRRTGSPITYAGSFGRAHPTIALWATELAGQLRRDLEAGERRVRHWADEQGATRVDWGTSPIDPFFNINTPADLAEAERLIAA